MELLSSEYKPFKPKPTGLVLEYIFVLYLYLYLYLYQYSASILLAKMQFFEFIYMDTDLQCMYFKSTCARPNITKKAYF